MNKEGILVELGYTANEAEIEKLNRILSKCDFDNTVLSKIITLNDKLKIFDGYIAMSNSEDYFKIKNESQNPENQKAAEDIILTWSKKYKIEVEKVKNKNTYYIIGAIR